MSLSQTQQSQDLHDQITILIGSAIRLLKGDAGVFVVSNEAFDPQSSTEYTLYNLDESACVDILAYIGERKQPNSACPLLVDTLPPLVVMQLGIAGELLEASTEPPAYERCSLFLYDHAGVLGILHAVRPAGARSCFESAEEPGGTIRLFITHLAAGLRSALKSQSLVKEQLRFAAIFQQSDEGILTVDTALRIIDFNPAMERLTGWLESEVLGRFYYEVLRPRDRQGNELGLEGSPILQAFAGQKVVNREVVISARDGQRFDVSVTASCVRSAKGEPTSGILTIRDITREREQEEQRSTFISVISHELQTPIAIIKGYASTLARADATFDAESLRARLNAIEEEADRLNKLVGNLLYASRIQAGGLQMDIAPLDLSRLIRSVVHRLQVKSPDVKVELKLPSNLPAVMADRDRIEEVLQNLLDNAMKYSPDRRELTIACRATGDEVIVSVSDTGMGISLREQEQIFNRFHRAGDGIASSTQGAGLGLYISRAIVEAHGGHIWVESTLHQGSTFSFSLPREEKAYLPMVVF
ncbi:MAG TPA: ATP-binding protein [Ktedonobacteraceae bacterium]|jgi:PAS domain S-box-containing protein|nr:ATP-binding protein [Ktedonobacteraceae bacterium]